jgi:hypothetical protein
MRTIQMAPGATVISAPTHQGLERLSSGADILTTVFRDAVHALAVWRDAYVEAQAAARMVELAAHDPRALAELRALLQRDPR